MAWVRTVLLISLSFATLLHAAEIAPRTLFVSGDDPAARDEGAGTQAQPYKTISRAAKLAQPGDTVVVRSGTYRERVSPARSGKEGAPITYMAAPGERVVVKGSDVWSPKWAPVVGHVGVFSAKLTEVLAADDSPLRFDLGNLKTRKAARPASGEKLQVTAGQLFIEGELLLQVGSLSQLDSTPGSWLVGPDGSAIQVHPRNGQAPTAGSVEVSVRNWIFAPAARGLQYITVKGFTFEHCANSMPWPQVAAVSVRSGSHWIVEGNTIRFARTIGLDCGSEGWENMEALEGDNRVIIVGDNQVIGNTVSDNGLCGISGWNHDRIYIGGNIVERNNWLGSIYEYEEGGIKLHDMRDGSIVGNLIRDNDGMGIWIDQLYKNVFVSRNLIVNNLLCGVFFEIGFGPATCDNNVIAYTRAGDGVYTHDASGVTVAHNLFFYNAHYGVWMQNMTDRKAGDKIGETSDQRIVNNIFMGNEAGAVSLPVPNARSHGNISEDNVMLGGGPQLSLDPARFRLNHALLPDEALKEFAAKFPALKDAILSDQTFSLEQWRTLGFDKQSTPAHVDKHMLASRTSRLLLEIDDAPLKIKAQAVPGVSRDFFGVAIPGVCIPGPFQDLKAGVNEFVLWPIQLHPRM